MFSQLAPFLMKHQYILLSLLLFIDPLSGKKPFIKGKTFAKKTLIREKNSCYKKPLFLEEKLDNTHKWVICHNIINIQTVTWTLDMSLICDPDLGQLWRFAILTLVNFNDFLRSWPRLTLEIFPYFLNTFPYFPNSIPWFIFYAFSFYFPCYSSFSTILPHRIHTKTTLMNWYPQSPAAHQWTYRE